MTSIRLGSILRARCPACLAGPVMRSPFSIYRQCPNCNYDFHPEPGFYLGAMAISFLITAILTVPPMVILKLMKVEIGFLIAFPFIEFLFLGTFLMFYSRILWLHLEYRMTQGLDGGRKSNPPWVETRSQKNRTENREE
jgi:uncharacterized protein (DUF983 family)